MKAKINGVPQWMRELGNGHADSKHFNGNGNLRCVWICCQCGSPSFFESKDGKHAGPALRDEDPRYAFAQGPCWRSKDYKLKCSTPKGWRVIKHDGAPDPDDSVNARMSDMASTVRRLEREAKKKTSK